MLTYEKRATFCSNPIAKKLLTLMEQKKTNLSLAADVTTSEELLSLADSLGPDLCILKTHIDILKDFTPLVTKQLRELAKHHQFLLFEDRKFADIGNTSALQYEGGIYSIAEWADIINAHIVPGPGIIAGLRKVGLAKGSGLLLLAEMSAEGTMATGAYTKKAVEMARAAPDFVMGFISLGALSKEPQWIYMTPGIQLIPGKDHLGQQYKTPYSAIEAGTDVIIVGRGIYEANDPKSQATLYREAGWEAYVRRCQ